MSEYVNPRRLIPPTSASETDTAARRIIHASKRSVVFRLAMDRLTTRRKNLAATSQTARPASPDLNLPSALGFASLINQRPRNRRQMRSLAAVEARKATPARTTAANSGFFKRFKRFETLRYKLPHSEFTHRKLTYNVQVTRASHTAAGIGLMRLIVY